MFLFSASLATSFSVTVGSSFIISLIISFSVAAAVVGASVTGFVAENFSKFESISELGMVGLLT